MRAEPPWGACCCAAWERSTASLNLPSVMASHARVSRHQAPISACSVSLTLRDDLCSPIPRAYARAEGRLVAMSVVTYEIQLRVGGARKEHFGRVDDGHSPVADRQHLGAGAVTAACSGNRPSRRYRPIQVPPPSYRSRGCPMNRTRASAVGVAALVALLATACARPVTTLDPGPSVAATGQVGLVPYDGCPALNRFTPLPADAVLVSAERCRNEVRDVPGDGQWLFRIVDRATTDLAPLADALRRPSERNGGICLAILNTAASITVTDQQGRRITPTLPQTSCDDVLPAVRQAINALVWVPIESTKLSQVQPELAISSGCAGSWKPTVALEASSGSNGPVHVKQFATTATTLKVCRYSLDPSPTGNDGGDIRGGRLVAASTLDSAGAHALLSAVANAQRATGACAQRESPFAVVQPAAGDGVFITIELSGCYRVLVDNENYLRQLDAATVHQLLGP